MKTKKYIIDVISFLFFILFVYTATAKLMDFRIFTDQINNQPFDNKYTPLITWGVPSLEFILATLLTFQRTRLAGFYGGTTLMLLFTGYVALVTFNFYDRTPCSCGGLISRMNWSQHLVFNSCFVVMGLVAIVLERKIKTTKKTEGNDVLVLE